MLRLTVSCIARCVIFRRLVAYPPLQSLPWLRWSTCHLCAPVHQLGDCLAVCVLLRRLLVALLRALVALLRAFAHVHYLLGTVRLSLRVYELLLIPFVVRLTSALSHSYRFGEPSCARNLTAECSPHSINRGPNRTLSI